MTTTQEVELFLHRQGTKPRALIAARHEMLREALERVGVVPDGGNEILVFVGECDEALAELDEIEDGADVHAPVDIGLTIEVLEIDRFRHVHCHMCRHIATEITFNGKTKRHRFSPSTTVATATMWAKRKFHLDPEAAADYVLEICGTTHKPRADKHLGELVNERSCNLCFTIVTEINPQG
jgi:hypothetical protein